MWKAAQHLTMQESNTATCSPPFTPQILHRQVMSTSTL